MALVNSAVKTPAKAKAKAAAKAKAKAMAIKDAEKESGTAETRVDPRNARNRILNFLTSKKTQKKATMYIHISRLLLRREGGSD